MSINENQIYKFNSEKSISKIINKSRNLKKLNKFNTIGFISNSTKLPNVSNLKRNLSSKNNFSITATNLKNNINNYSPKIPFSSKLKKLNSFSPMNTDKIRINYFNEISDKKINFSSLKKSNTIQNLKIQSNIFKKMMHNYNNNIYNKNNNKKNEKNKNLIQLHKKKFSRFYYKSKNSSYSSENIFSHYINEAENEKIIPEKYFYKGGMPKPKKDIDELYKLNMNYFRRLEELKCNKSIAFKKDFDIFNYQSTLIKLISKKVSDNYILELQDKYLKFNESLNNQRTIIPRGRFTNLAEKIKYNIPRYLYEKIKKLDKDKLISRYNYFKNIQKNIHSNVEELKSKREKLNELKNKSQKKKNNISNSF